MSQSATLLSDNGIIFQQFSEYTLLSVKIAGISGQVSTYNTDWKN
jgi:hypothetical protein